MEEKFHVSRLYSDWKKMLADGGGCAWHLHAKWGARGTTGD